MLRLKYLAAHELNGLKTRILDSPDAKLVGLEGLVLRESRNMFILKLGNNRVVSIPKQGTRFRFYVSERDSAELDGTMLCCAPESRTKRLLRLH